MTPRAVLWLAVVLAEVGACVLAAWWELATFRAAGNKLASWQQIRRFPISALLACAVVIDLAVGLHDPPSSWGLSALAAAGPRPRVGLARAAYHLADALVMAWPGLLAVTCGRVFGPPLSRIVPSPPSNISDGKTGRLDAIGRQTAKLQNRAISQFATSARDVLAGCYLGAVVSLAMLYPLGHARTQALLLAWEAVALAFAASAIFAGWRRVVAGGPPWTRAHGVLLVLVPVEAAVAVIGPFARENVFAAWDVARWQYLLGFVVVAGLLAWPVKRRS